MNATDSALRRSVPISLLAVVAMIAALLASVVAGDHGAGASGHDGEQLSLSSAHAADRGRDSASPALTAKESAFRDQMRKLWEDHITWTRLAIVTFADRSAGFEATAGRLLQNQEDIGDAIEPFYGEAAGDQLTALLNDHITIAVEVLEAASAGDDAAVTEALERWYANSDDIADFLAAANPRYWPSEAMRHAMSSHLDQTLAEAQHELAGEYAASVDIYDEIHAHILHMADVLSDGILRSFPQRFR